MVFFKFLTSLLRPSTSPFSHSNSFVKLLEKDSHSFSPFPNCFGFGLQSVRNGSSSSNKCWVKDPWWGMSVWDNGVEHMEEMLVNVLCCWIWELHEGGANGCGYGDEIVLVGVNANGVDAKDGGMKGCVLVMTGDVRDGVMTDCEWNDVDGWPSAVGDDVGCSSTLMLEMPGCRSWRIAWTLGAGGSSILMVRMPGRRSCRIALTRCCWTCCCNFKKKRVEWINITDYNEPKFWSLFAHQ